jgi:hypothetical protein
VQQIICVKSTLAKIDAINRRRLAMSLASRIIFVSSMLAFAALCTWVALAYGGPAGPVMWGLSAACVGISVVVWLIKARPPKILENIRVEGAREPTFRLLGSDKGTKGKIWQLVLGNTQCTLIRPDGTRATTFARKWADTAIRLPGFVNGELLGIATEEWSPPDEERFITQDALFNAAKSIRRTSDRDTPYYWFSPSKELIREIEEYRRRTVAELGAEAAGPLLIKARQSILSGLVGLAAGIGLLIFRFMSAAEPAAAPAKSGEKVLTLGAIISLIGLWRIGQGIVLHRQAGRIAQEGGPSTRVG